MKRIPLSARALLLALFSALILPAAGCAGAENDRDILVSVPTGIEKIRRDAPLSGVSGKAGLKIALARNEYESAQFVIRSDTKDIVNPVLTVGGLKSKNGGVIPPENIQIYQQHYIHVDTASAPGLETGWYPDALIPVQPGFTVKMGENQGYWITVKSDGSQPAGIYKGKASLKYEGGELVLPIELEVWDFSLPITPSAPSAFAIWMHQLGEFYKIGGEDYRSSAKYWELMEEYYWFQTSYRLAPDDFPFEYSTADEFVEKAAPYISDPRVSAYRIPFFLGYLPDGGYDLKKEANRELVGKLREAGLLEKGYYYITIIDEPAPDKYGLVREICETVKEIAPDVRSVVTKEPVPELEGYVETWCPVYYLYDKGTAAERQSLCEQVWWYGCVAPKFPYPTYHIDDRLLSARLVSWMQRDFGVQGHLYWSTSVTMKYDAEMERYVDRDVWADPFAFPGAPGDGFLLYPGKEGDGIVNKNAPVPTLRLEAARDGAEDYEYLLLLEKTTEKKIEELGLAGVVSVRDVMEGFYSQLYASISDFETDPQKLLDMRGVIARAIVNSDLENLLMCVETPMGTGHGRARTVRLYAPADAAISVKAGGKAVKFTSEKAGTNALAHTAELELNGRMDLEITLTRGKTRHVFTRILHTPAAEEGLSKTTLLDFETEYSPQMLRRLYNNRGDLKSLEISSDYATGGEHSLKAVFDPATDWTEMNIFTMSFEREITDWSEYKYLEFDVTNPPESARNRQLYLILGTEEAGRTAEIIRTVEKGATTTVRLPLRTGTQGGLDKISYIKIGLSGALYREEAAEGITLYFDNIRLLKETAENGG